MDLQASEESIEICKDQNTGENSNHTLCYYLDDPVEAAYATLYLATT